MGQPITVEDTLTHVTHLRYDSQGRVTNAADPLLNETVFTYNIAGQCDSATLPEAVVSAGHAVQTTSYLYPGGPVVQTDAYPPGSGSPMRTVNLAYGHEGELLSRTGDCEEVSYTYDPVYRVLTLSDGVPNTTTYTYDALGHLTDVDLPGATGGNFDQTHFTSFDLQGNCLSRTDGLGVVTDYTYGTSSADDGLLSLVNYPGTSQSVTLGRDVFDRVDSVTDFAGVETYDHDYLGNVTSKTTTYTTVTAQTFDYTFYPDGSRETMVNSAGTWTYYYDSDGRCRRMDSPADVGGVHFTSTYFDDDTQDRRTLPNGMYTDNTYDNLGLPASVLNKNGGGTVKSQFDTFTYDGVFNMTSVTTSNHTVAGFNGTTNYAYDSQDRLTSDSSPTKTNGGAGYSESFAYDGAGNPTTWKSASQTFNSDNQLTATGYAFDGNGNATTYAAATLAYDPEDRLKQFNVTGVSKFYKWRADGLKAWDSVVYSTNATISPANVGTYYYYDRGNAVLETSSGGTVNQVNVFAPDGLVARKESGAYKYYQFDQQGNAVTRSNSAGTVTSGACYDAYGLNFFSPQAGDTFRYNARWGYRLDADTGLTLCQHRYYDAGNGRWVNRDPIGYSGGANLYGYCESGPVGREDAAGLAHIYVCRTHIAGDHWHAVIVITDGKNPYKRAAVAEAFPNWDVAHGGRLLGNLSGGARDENSYLVGGGELRYEDDNSVDYWKKQLKRIIPDEVPYWLFPYEGCGGGNSNSWVRECLERMGLDPRYPKDGIFPGWEADPWDSIWHAK